MPWTKTNYPAEMNYLPIEVRNRAIKIANALIRETLMQERMAIKAAISQARQLSTKHELKYDNGLKGRGTDSRKQFKDLFVIPFQDGWAIRVEASTKVQEVFKTKKQALKRARREAFLIGAKLTIYKKDGSLERRANHIPSNTLSGNNKLRKKKKVNNNKL